LGVVGLRVGCAVVSFRVGCGVVGVGVDTLIMLVDSAS